MYEEYVKRGGTKSREEFEKLLAETTNVISGYYLFPPPRQEVQQTAFYCICESV